MLETLPSTAGRLSGRQSIKDFQLIQRNFSVLDLGMVSDGGADHILALADRYVQRSRATAQTLTIPANATAAIPIGAVVRVTQTGAGALTVQGAVGVTVNKASDRTLVAVGLGAVVLLEKTAINTWTASGDLTAASTAVVDSGAADVVLAVGNALVLRSRATAQTVTLPQDSVAAIPVGTKVDIVQTGAGALTIQAGAGATMQENALYTAVVQGQHGRVTAIKIAANTWNVSGGLTLA